MRKSITRTAAATFAVTFMSVAGLTNFMSSGVHAAETESLGSHEDMARKYPEDEQGALKFSPRVLWLGDMLRIAAPEEHPRGLAIMDPSGVWYFLQEADSPQPQFMEPGKFAKTRLLELDTRTIGGTVWVDGKAVQKPAFTKTGEYLIYMADEMETEPENTFSLMGTVYFFDHRPTTK